MGNRIPLFRAQYGPSKGGGHFNQSHILEERNSQPYHPEKLKHADDIITLLLLLLLLLLFCVCVCVCICVCDARARVTISTF